jgi:hypothetical protein
MSTATAEDLINADSRLTRSFFAAVLTWGSSFVWALFLAPTPQINREGVPWAPLVILILQITTYVWYAIAAGAAARMLGAPGGRYVAWILAAPFLALLPIPIVSTIIGVSPLSIKFLLGGQLQSAIREATLAQMHQPS